MEVEITLYFTLRERLGWFSKRLRLPREKTQLRNVLKFIPELERLLIQDGGLNSDYRILIDGRNVVFLGGLDAEVGDGSRIVVFPPAGGG